MSFSGGPQYKDVWLSKKIKGPLFEFVVHIEILYFVHSSFSSSSSYSVVGGPVAVDAVKRCNQPGNGIRPMTNQNWSLLFTMMMVMMMIGITIRKYINHHHHHCSNIAMQRCLEIVWHPIICEVWAVTPSPS